MVTVCCPADSIVSKHDCNVLVPLQRLLLCFKQLEDPLLRKILSGTDSWLSVVTTLKSFSPDNSSSKDFLFNAFLFIFIRCPFSLQLRGASSVIRQLFCLFDRDRHVCFYSTTFFLLNSTIELYWYGTIVYNIYIVFIMNPYGTRVPVSYRYTPKFYYCTSIWYLRFFFFLEEKTNTYHISVSTHYCTSWVLRTPYSQNIPDLWSNGVCIVSYRTSTVQIVIETGWNSGLQLYLNFTTVHKFYVSNYETKSHTVRYWYRYHTVLAK